MLVYQSPHAEVLAKVRSSLYTDSRKKIKLFNSYLSTNIVKCLLTFSCSMRNSRGQLRSLLRNGRDHPTRDENGD